jgi:hypothetical protein
MFQSAANAFGVKKESGQLNKTRRLITFGDSFTYGQYLPDRSTQSWPAVLSSLLKYELVNNAICGSSNIEILIEILKFDFRPDDLVIVGWTFIERDIIFKKQTLLGKLFNWHDHIRIQAWQDNEESLQYINLHNDFDMAVRSGLYVHHSELYLKSLGVEQYHIHTQNRNTKPEYFCKPNHFIKNFKFVRTDKALDNSHPGVESHRQTANKIFSKLNEQSK